jgi:DNA-directed RNA polymerase subunit H (RpoH/RPB5)
MDIQKVIHHSIELLELRGEDVSSFKEKIEEIDTNRFYNEVITVSTKNITVFYTFSKESFKELWSSLKVMDVQNLEKTYTTLKYIIILQEYPPSITLQAIQQKDVLLQEHKGFIQFFLTRELMYNPMKHELVPKHKKMTEEEIKKLMEETQLKSKNQLPLIQKQDIIARWLGLYPGDIVKITRYTETSGKYYYYRCCV